MLHLSKLVIWGSGWGRGFRFHWLGSIDELLAAPAEERWRGQTVEFCGGTHISDASEAAAFVVLEEKAVAKGIRLIIIIIIIVDIIMTFISITMTL